MKQTLAKVESTAETLFFVETIKNNISKYDVHYIVDNAGKVSICETENFLEAELAFTLEAISVCRSITKESATVEELDAIQTDLKTFESKIRLELALMFNELTR